MMYHFRNGKLVPIVAADIPIGQILSFLGYGNEDQRLVVYQIDDNTVWGKSYHCVNVDEMTLTQHTRVRPITEKHGIGVYYTPGNIYDKIEELPRLVEEAKENDRIEELRRKEVARKAAEAEQIEREALPVMYPYLLTKKDNPKTSSHALGAKNIKRELQKEFPNVKFKVNSSAYSMGDSIHIYWDNGPTQEEVRFFTEKYQECDFDGMQDLQTYRHQVFTDVFGGAHYVFERREETPARRSDRNSR